MKKLLTIIILMLCNIAITLAQGSVTVTQSSDIDVLVNGKKADKKTSSKKQTSPSATQSTTLRHQLKEPVVERIISSTVPSYTQQSSKNSSSAPRTKLVKKLVRKPHIPTPEELAGEGQIVTKHLMHTTKKVRGFRVQVYSGGNTRVAHKEADKAGQKAKMLFPSQPVYVHFYTPRWMCLVGNFTDYRLAHKVALKMRKEGYPNANVIRTMVSVRVTQEIGETTPKDTIMENYLPY